MLKASLAFTDLSWSNEVETGCLYHSQIKICSLETFFLDGLLGIGKGLPLGMR